MKRYGYLYEKIYNKDNLRRAIINASNGKHNRENVRYILNNIDHYTDILYALLVEEMFEPSPYNCFTIYDQSSNKEREIFAPKFFPDQVVHWAIMQVIQPYLELPMYHLSCGSRPYKGAHYGKRYLEKWLKNDIKHTKYCLKLDIRKFYPSIKQSKLMDLLDCKFKDEKLLNLLYSIISSTENGIPIGNYTSQWFANYYLTPLDNYIKCDLRIKYYIRYMDDMVILGSNKKELHKTKIKIERFLNDYGLSLKDNWQVFRVDDRSIDFMGFRFYHNRTILRKRTALRIRRKFRRASKNLNYKNASACMSYMGWVKSADMKNFYLKYISPYFNIKMAKEVIRNENRKRC
ncbi:MAG: RNA-directed DNA polymerase [Oscillospiraceae bacterium]|nr:RNA-directed DNA polymerase [Candidatus Limimonas egerieequi]